MTKLWQIVPRRLPFMGLLLPMRQLPFRTHMPRDWMAAATALFWALFAAYLSVVVVMVVLPDLQLHEFVSAAGVPHPKIFRQ